MAKLSSKQFAQLITKYVRDMRPHQGLGQNAHRLELRVRSLNLNRLP